MNSVPPPIPVATSAGLSIRYNLTRMDIFLTSLTIFFRNRVLQVFVLALLVFNGWRTLAPEFHERTILETIKHGVGFLVIFCGMLAVLQCLFGAISAFFLKHKGVVGQHVLEITPEGLIERTEVNETLHKWPGIQRIISTDRNLYIYTGNENFHLVPKRELNREELRAFETALRARANTR